MQGNQWNDLEYTGTAFQNEVSAWTHNFALGNGPTMTCGTTTIFGGYNIMSPNEYVQRKYTGLPDHDMVIVSISLWRLDSWDGGDYANVTIESTSYTFQNMVFSRSIYANLCGHPSYKDGAGLNIVFKLYHTEPTLTIRVTNKCSSAPTDESLAIRDVSIIFKFKSDEETNYVAQQGNVYALTPPPGAITNLCTSNNQYYSNSVCSNCSSACFLCTGPTEKDCLKCNFGYYMVNGTCLPCYAGCRTCSDGGILSCTTCISTYYLFSDNTCRPNCGGVSTTGPPSSCICPNTQWTLPNGTCNTTCDNYAYNQVNLTTEAFCNWKCIAEEYIFPNGTCTTCPFPFRKANGTDGNFCLFPCINSNDYYYENGTCKSTCPSHFVKYDTTFGFYCNFPCAKPLFYRSDGTCNHCDFPLRNYTLGNESYCYFPCADNSFFIYNNGTCSKTCSSPFVKLNITIGAYCNFPCDSDSYYYLNGTCTTDCDWPMTMRQFKLEKYCDFPCDFFHFYYPDLTCRSFCEYPYKIRDVSVGYYCDFACPGFNYFYYANGSCLTTCPSPLKIDDTSTGVYCNFPCSDSSLFYYKENATCLPTCPGPFISTNISVGFYCNFPCPANNYLYLNGTCRTTCPKQFFKIDVSIGKYCNFPCRNFEYSYSNGTCSQDPCEYPFYANIQRYEYYCDFKCGDDDYLYQNGTCSSRCPYPYVEREEYGYHYCDFPCQNTSLYYYSNGSCLNNCSYPFHERNASVGLFCDFACNSTQFYRGVNESCWDACIYPQRAENRMSYYYCNPPVDRVEFSYMKIGAIAFTALSGLFIVADPTVFWGLMTTYQDVSYLLFYNINFTYDAQTYFKAMQVGNFYFLPSASEIFGTGSMGKPSSDALSNFQQNGYTTAFLETSSRSITFLFITGMGGIVMFFVYIASRKGIRLFQNIATGGIAPIVLRLWIGVSSQFVYAAFLQFTNFDFSTGVGVISNLLAMATIGGMAYSIYFMYKKAIDLQEKPLEVKKRDAQKWPAIFGGLNIENKKAAKFHIFETVRRSMKAIPVVFLYNNPKVQTTMGMAFNMGVSYILKNQPMKSELHNLALVVKEIALIFAQTLILMKASFKLKVTNEQLGLMIIMCCLVAIGSMVLFSAIKMIKIFVDWLLAPPEPKTHAKKVFPADTKPSNDPFKSTPVITLNNMEFKNINHDISISYLDREPERIQEAENENDNDNDAEKEDQEEEKDEIESNLSKTQSNLFDKSQMDDTQRSFMHTQKNHVTTQELESPDKLKQGDKRNASQKNFRTLSNFDDLDDFENKSIKSFVSGKSRRSLKDN